MHIVSLEQVRTPLADGTAPLHRIRLSMAFEEQGRRGRITMEVEALHHRKHYELPDYRPRVGSKIEAEHFVLKDRATVAFMDATGLKRSAASASVFSRKSSHGWTDYPPTCFAHVKVWRSADGLIVVTAEPYTRGLEAVLAWCATHGWEHTVLPSGIGMHNPLPLGGTHLVLMSPAKNGASIASLVPALLRAPELRRGVVALGSGRFASFGKRGAVC